MPSKLTAEIVNQRLAANGRCITMIGAYVSSETKTMFQCSKNHTWNALPSSVMANHGCPHCAGLAPLSCDIVNKRLAERGIMLISEYVNTREKSVFRCDNGHEWQMTLKSIMRGRGCPICSGIVLSRDIVNERIAARKIVLIGEYINTNINATFQCSKGHLWDATPSHVMKGCGCPVCCRIATDANVFYIWEIISPFVPSGIYKVGITSANRRYDRIGACAAKNGVSAKIVLKMPVADARAIERQALAMGTPESAILADGNTEVRRYTPTELERIKAMAMAA